MDNGILYDPTQDPDATQAPVSLPMLDSIQQQTPPPSMWQNAQQGLRDFGNTVGTGIGNAANYMQQRAQQDPGLFLAAAAGIGKGTPMGDMASSIQSHFNLQDELQQKKDSQAAMLKMQQSKLDETARLNSSKIDANTALALKNGTAKVTNLGNGFVQVMKPGDTVPTQIASQDYQDFVRGNIQMKGEYGIAAAGAKLDAQPKSPAQEKLEGDALAKAQGAQETLQRWQEAKDLLEKQGAPGLAGLPFVSRIAQVLGSDTTAAYQVLSQLAVDETFTNVPKGQGSMSNLERATLRAPMPSMDASTDTWLAYLNRRIPLIESTAAKHQAYYDSIANQPRQGMSNARDVIGEMRQQYPTNAPGNTQQPQAQPVQPQAQPVQPQQPQAQPQAAKPTQAYPKGFNPPNAGVAPNNDGRIDILKQELADETNTPNSDPQRHAANLTAIQKELLNLGYKPQSLQPAPAAAPAAAAPMRFTSNDDAMAAYKAGKLKSGDTFIGPDGKIRKVH